MALANSDGGSDPPCNFNEPMRNAARVGALIIVAGLAPCAPCAPCAPGAAKAQAAESPARTRPVQLAAQHALDATVSGDHHGGGEYFDASMARHHALRVQDDRQLQAALLHKAPHRGGCLLEVDYQRLQVGPMLLRQRLQRRHLGAAGLAPAGPEVDQHRLAAQVRQTPSWPWRSVANNAGTGWRAGQGMTSQPCACAPGLSISATRAKRPKTVRQILFLFAKSSSSPHE